MAWTEEMVENLKKYWDEGLTTGAIGKKLGVSKNSVVGKVHRLKLTARPSPIKRSKKTEAKKTEEKKKTDKISLLDLNIHTCRWPNGDPRDDDFHFCGKKVQAGNIYCDEHSKIAFVKPTKK